MVVKQRKAPSKTKKKNANNISEKLSKEDSENENTTLAVSSSPQARFLSPLNAMIFLVAIAVAIYVANRNLQFNPGYIDYSTRQLFEPSTQTVHAQKWGAFNGIATITKAYRVVKMVHHDPTAFTQGLQVHRDQLVESTGLYGESLVRIWDPHTGIVSKETPKLDPKYFGEGLTHYQDEDGNDRYIMLTWQEQTAFIYDMDLNLIHTFAYGTKTNEGWGITFDAVKKIFYVSDGSAYLHVWNLKFQEIDRFPISYQVDPSAPSRIEINHINELEWDATDGTVLANIWYQNVILRIDPQRGQVLQIYDLSDLYVDRTATADCLNGIAHQGGNRWWLTGKFWPYLYLVEFLE